MENSTEQPQGQTKKCRKCGESVQVSAKKCKYCQSDLRNWFVRHKIITGILVLIVMITIANVTGSNNKSNSAPAAQKAEYTKYKINDIIKTDKFEIAITSVQEKSEVGSEFFQSSPSEGGTYVAVRWKYKNISNKPAGMFSTPLLRLVDSNGVFYSADINASGNFATELKLDRKIISDLNPGISVNDASVFEVSKEQFAKGGWSILIKVDGKDYQVSLQ